MSAADRPEVALRRKRLRAWIDAHFEGRTADFIRAHGLNQGEVSGLLRNKSFGEKRAASLEAATGMPPGYLSAPDSESASETTRVTSTETPEDYVRFQLLDGAAGMGDGVENSDYPEVIREVDIAGWEVRRKLGFTPRPGRIKLLTGRGPSMRPMIDNGDVVMVDTEIHAFDGDAVYVINLGGETLIKMLQMRGDGLYVVSANADYPAYKIDRDGVVVGGKVVSVVGIKPV